MNMTMRVGGVLIVTLALLGAADPPMPNARTVAIDGSKTQVEFIVDSLLHTVHGEFRWKRGSLAFDPATGKASGELVVDATSGDSGNRGRDKRMHAAILESAKYPEIVFRPDRVDGEVSATGHSTLQMHGIFTIHGADHEMLVPVTLDSTGGRLMAVALIEVPYVKWGMKNPSSLMLRVSDKVHITVRTLVSIAQ
jgi:polyisoprenoid-binding protein YceI